MSYIQIKFMYRKLASWISIGLGATGALLCLVALGRSWHWRVEMGNLGAWVGGIGSFIAVSVALWTTVSNRSREVQEKSARAIRKAKRVTVQPTRARYPMVFPDNISGGLETPCWRVELRNNSGNTIYDIEWLGGIAFPVPPNVGTLSEFAMAYSDGHDEKTQALTDGGVIYAFYMPMKSTDNHFLLPVIKFSDEEGYEFLYVLSRESQSPIGPVRGHWKHQGKDDLRTITDSKQRGIDVTQYLHRFGPGSTRNDKTGTTDSASPPSTAP